MRTGWVGRCVGSSGRTRTWPVAVAKPIRTAEGPPRSLHWADGRQGADRLGHGQPGPHPLPGPQRLRPAVGRPAHPVRPRRGGPAAVHPGRGGHRPADRGVHHPLPRRPLPRAAGGHPAPGPRRPLHPESGLPPAAGLPPGRRRRVPGPHPAGVDLPRHRRASTPAPSEAGGPVAEPWVGTGCWPPRSSTGSPRSGSGWRSRTGSGSTPGLAEAAGISRAGRRAGWSTRVGSTPVRPVGWTGRVRCRSPGPGSRWPSSWTPMVRATGRPGAGDRGSTCWCCESTYLEEHRDLAARLPPPDRPPGRPSWPPGRGPPPGPQPLLGPLPRRRPVFAARKRPMHDDVVAATDLAVIPVPARRPGGRPADRPEGSGQARSATGTG